MVSDWASIQQMIPHGYSANLRQAAAQAVNAGVDIDMEGYAYCSHLNDLIEKGEVSVAHLDSLVANVLRLKYRLGLFENPYVDMTHASQFYAPSSLEAARKAVEESAILLKNSGVLPISSEAKKILVVGPMANAAHDQAGTWSFDLEKSHCVTPLTALEEMYGKKNITYVAGLEYSRDLSTAGFAAAKKAAKSADIILYFAGEEAMLSGEAHCRTDLTLPGAQSQLLKELKATGKPVVLVIQAGRPLALTEDAEQADAVVFCFHGGTMAGPGLANLLSGKVNFSGHSPVSFPRTSGQVPIYYNRKNTGRPAENFVLINDIEREAGQTSTGCTSYYLDAGDGALFPFGYGLSYTTFSYSDPVVSATEIPADGSLTVTCTVTNTGSVAGEEVAQLYIRDHVASLIRPVRELRGFQKFSLKPGESRQVSFTLSANDLAFVNADFKRVVEPGEFSVWIAPNSNEGTAAKFNVVGDVYEVAK
jgi:beta-glucosidase